MSRTLVQHMCALVLGLMLLAPACLAQNQPNYPELPKFHRVNEHLYRGAQPQPGGIEKLAELGIKTIINLRGEDEHTRAQQAAAEAMNLRYHNVALPAWGRPAEEKIAQLLDLLAAPENWPVFIHCKRGVDRTGTVIACQRIAHEGWTGEQALAEAKRQGMSWIQVWMKDYVSDFYERHHSTGKARTLVQPRSTGTKAGAVDSSTISPGSDEGADDKIGAGIRVVETAIRKGERVLIRSLKQVWADNDDK